MRDSLTQGSSSLDKTIYFSFSFFFYTLNDTLLMTVGKGNQCNVAWLAVIGGWQAEQCHFE